MGGSLLDPEPLVRTVKDGGMLNKTLVLICAADGLSKAGVKLELQTRIIDRGFLSLLPSPHHFSTAYLSLALALRFGLCLCLPNR